MMAPVTTTPAPVRVRERGWVAVVGAVATGIGLALAFPPVDLLGGWAAIPILAALVAGFRGVTPRRGALLGLAAGMGFFLVLLEWLRVLGPDAWVVLSLLCASFWAGAGALMPRVLAGRWWILGVPALWVTVEGLRSRVPWGGFPWGRLAHAQAGTELVGWAVLGGPALVSFVVATLAMLLLAAVDMLRARRAVGSVEQVSHGRPLPARHPGRVVLGLGLASLGLVLAGGALRTTSWGGPITGSEPMAIVQGNVPRVGLDFNAQRRAVLDNHVRVTEELAQEVAAGREPQPVAVIWPENASDVDPLRNADAAAQIDRAARAIAAPILVGAVITNPADPPTEDHPGTILNVGIVWDPVTGPGQAYAKRHPVPFGEYLPFRDLLTRFITRFERIGRDFAGGEAVGVLDVGGVRTGVVICFEVAYDELVRDAVREGGQVMVVQTNNATYGRTGQPEQQLAITRVQAVASGRTTLVAATSGISAVINTDGSLAWQTPQFTAASTVAEVPQRQGITPAMQLGGFVELAAAGLLAVILIAGRRRHAPASGERGPAPE